MFHVKQNTGPSGGKNCLADHFVFRDEIHFCAGNMKKDSKTGASAEMQGEFQTDACKINGSSCIKCNISITFTKCQIVSRETLSTGESLW